MKNQFNLFKAIDSSHSSSPECGQPTMKPATGVRRKFLEPMKTTTPSSNRIFLVNSSSSRPVLTGQIRATTNQQQVSSGSDNKLRSPVAASRTGGCKPSSLDLAQCYEEIDQIYDYIRGLAPLPANLRRLKSIDFEQIEREKQTRLETSLKLQRAAAARQRQPDATIVPKNMPEQQQQQQVSPPITQFRLPRASALPVVPTLKMARENCSEITSKTNASDSEQQSSSSERSGSSEEEEEEEKSSSASSPSSQPTSISDKTSENRSVPQEKAPSRQQPEHIYEQIPATNRQQQQQVVVFAPALPKEQQRHPVGGRPPAAMQPHHHHQQQQQHRFSAGSLQRLGSSQFAPTSFRPHHQQQVLQPRTTPVVKLAGPKQQQQPRAPRLSPAQFIAQLQMPRAVSKRQLLPAAASRQQVVAASGQKNDHAKDIFSNRKAARSSARRLTAIGIEGSLPVANFLQRQALEPAQLVGAPLIDEDDEDTSARRLNSITDLHSSPPSTSSSSSSSSSCGSSSANLASDHNSPKQTLKQSTSGRKFSLAASSQVQDTRDFEVKKSRARRLGAKLLNGERLLSLIGLDTLGLVEPAKTRQQQQQQQVKRKVQATSGSINVHAGSTSSYEAAVRNDPTRRHALSRQNNQQQQQPTLVRVPKLSRQSHLLNRPLPRPPTSMQPLVQQTKTNFSLNAAPAHRSHRGTGQSLNYLANLRTSGQGANPPRNPTSSTSVARNSRRQQAPLSTDLDAEIIPRARQIVCLNKSKLTPAAASGKTPIKSAVSQPSPTVTTYTSSGISSRLTGGGAGRRGPSTTSSSAASSGHQQQQVAPARQSAGSTVPKATKSDDDDDELDEARSQADDELKRSNLRLFDEKFSAKFIDQQLASSNDSLLESIDFSGTLNSRRASSSGLITGPLKLRQRQKQSLF